MIIEIHGRIVHKEVPWMTLESGSLRYRMQATFSVFSNSSDAASWWPVRVIRRENDELWFAFGDVEEAGLFDWMISLDGIGPSLAFSLVNVLGKSLPAALEGGDSAALTKVPRVGKKSAEKIIFEAGRKSTKIHALNPAGSNTISHALLSMGFTDSEISKALSNLMREKAPSEADILADPALWIKETLRYL